MRLTAFLPACSIAWYATFVSANYGPFDESLKAHGLIGSYFGRIDYPGTFDYVIVGGGTAGLALANRLASSFSVAVIEAGGAYEMDNSNFTEVPSGATQYFGKQTRLLNPLLDWCQRTTPIAGFDNTAINYHSGRTLGGSSARNFLWYHRGSAGSYQQWADVVDDQSFAFDSFEKYMKRAVTFTPPARGTRAANATPMYDLTDFDEPRGGPVQVGYPSWANPATSYFSRGLEAIGLTEKPGMVNGDLLGWTYPMNTIEPISQKRSTSETGYLRNALAKGLDLTVYSNTLAKRVLFEGDRAIAVEVQSGRWGATVTYQLNATREVIVSGGAFRSPQLLMVSGIGPRATLDAYNIPVIADRPGVGQGMWDHVYSGVTYDTNVLTHGALGDPSISAPATTEYNANRTGILSNIGADLLAFEKLPTGAVSNSTRHALDTTFAADWPDVEYIGIDGWGGNWDDATFGAPRVANFSSMFYAIIAPFSRGNVTISSNDTQDYPVVNPNFYSDERDLEIAVAAFKRVRQALGSAAVQPVLKGPEAYPGSNVTTDDQIIADLRRSSEPVFHPACTCRMGKVDDEMAVVDSHARVIGVQGLRVVDASAFALLPPGHPQATVYGLAEKVAAQILRGE